MTYVSWVNIFDVFNFCLLIYVAITTYRLDKQMRRFINLQQGILEYLVPQKVPRQPDYKFPPPDVSPLAGIPPMGGSGPQESPAMYGVGGLDTGLNMGGHDYFGSSDKNRFDL